MWDPFHYSKLYVYMWWPEAGRANKYSFPRNKFEITKYQTDIQLSLMTQGICINEIGQPHSGNCLLPVLPVSQLNTLRPWQNWRHFADAIFKCIFLKENAQISIKISLKLVPKVQINNIPALIQIMAWCQPGDKPLSEPMMVSLLTHIWVTQPQWVYAMQSPSVTDIGVQSCPYNDKMVMRPTYIFGVYILRWPATMCFEHFHPFHWVSQPMAS